MSQTEPALVDAAASALPTEAARFAAELRVELARGPIVLLGYPEVALRVQQALNDENVNAATIVRLVGAEPVLANRVLSMANSAALGSIGGPVTELRTAVARMGVDTLRSAVVSYAMNQLRASKELAVVAEPMRRLWQTSVTVAALCTVLARRFGSCNPDSALLAGIMHGVGKLYLLIKARKFPAVLNVGGALEGLYADWHVTVSRTLMRQWQVPAIIADAVVGYEALEQLPEQQGPDLAGILALSCVIADHQHNNPTLESVMASTPGLARFNFSTDYCQEVLAESELQIAEVKDSLGM